MLLLFLLAGTAAQSADYGRYDLTQLAQQNAPPAKRTNLNVALVDQLLADLQQHAGNYPPRFDSPADAQRAKADAAKLMGMLGAVFSTGPAPPDMLLRMGMLGAVSHNMDIPSGATYAQTHFERLLKVDPTHAGGNFQYGTFLGNTGRAKEALPYLVKAKDKGMVPALYGIGMSHLMLGDQALAIENLQAYQKAVPGDASVGKLIDAVRAGKVDVKKAGGAMSSPVELPDPADLMKRVPKRFIKRVALLFLPFVLIYVGYFFYLGRHSLASSTPGSEAFWAIGNALLESQVGKPKKFAVALSTVDGPDMCSFWTFEAVRTHCEGVSLVVRDFEESDREKATQLARFIAEGLSNPCQHVALVAPPGTSPTGYMRSADHAKLRADLGCGSRYFSYRVRVQVRASKFIADPSGAGYYINRHVYTHSLQGEIQ